MWFEVKNLSSSFLIKPFKYVTFIKDEDKNILRIIRMPGRPWYRLPVQAYDFRMLTSEVSSSAGHPAEISMRMLLRKNVTGAWSQDVLESSLSEGRRAKTGSCCSSDPGLSGFSFLIQ